MTINNKTGNQKISILFPKLSAIPFEEKWTGIISGKKNILTNANKIPIPQINQDSFLLPTSFIKTPAFC